jgi:hypothetical protein
MISGSKPAQSNANYDNHVNNNNNNKLIFYVVV